MNRLFVYMVGVGVLILFMVIGWEVLQIATGLKSLVAQAVVEMPRDVIFPQNMQEFLLEKSANRSGLSDEVINLPQLDTEDTLPTEILN